MPDTKAEANTKADRIREMLCEEGYEETVVFSNPDYADAFIGVTDRGGVAVYDYELMVESLVREGMSYEDAMDFIDYNTIGAYFGEKTPIVIHSLHFEKEQRRNI